MSQEITISTKQQTKKNYILCEDNFLHYQITSFSQSKKHIDYFFSIVDDGGKSYLYVEKQAFEKLSLCQKILGKMNNRQIMRFLYNSTKIKNIDVMDNLDSAGKKYLISKAFIKLYSLPESEFLAYANDYYLSIL